MDYIKDKRGNAVPAYKGAQEILEAQACLARATSESGKAINQEYVDHYTAQLTAAGLTIEQALAQAPTSQPSKAEPTRRTYKSARPLTDTQLKERAYDAAYNEGAEGYNPYRFGSRPTYWRNGR